MYEKVKVDGQLIASVKRWRPPSWLSLLPEQIQKSGYFLTWIQRFGSYEPEEILGSTDVLDLLTNGGRDWMHNQVYVNTAAGSIAANILCLSTDTNAPNATDTTLAGELTASGLGRKVAGTITHTAGGNTSSLVASWTCTGASVAGIVKAATVNATSTVTYTMVHEGTVTTATLQINDVYTLTVNTTLG